MRMSRVSEYQAAPIDNGVRDLRAAGADPAAVSVACALERHADCDGTLYMPRDSGAADLCLCPVKDCGHGGGS